MNASKGHNLLQILKLTSTRSESESPQVVDHHQSGRAPAPLLNLLDSALHGQSAQSLGSSDRSVASASAIAVRHPNPSLLSIILRALGAMLHLQEVPKQSAVLCNQKGT